MRDSNVGALVPDIQLPDDALEKLAIATGLADEHKLAALCASIVLAGDVLVAVRQHDAETDHWTDARDRLDALTAQSETLMQSLERIDGDTAMMIEQSHMVHTGQWLDVGQLTGQTQSLNAAVSAARKRFPKGKQKDRTLGDTLAILADAYSKATGKSTHSRARSYLDFLALVGSWIELPATDLERHIKNQGTI